MKLISLFLVISVMAVAAPTKHSLKTDPKAVEDLIAKYDHEWAEAYLKRDIKKLNDLMSDDLVTTDATGATYLRGKSQDIHGVKTGQVSYDSFNIEEVHVNVHGDSAIAVGKFNMKGKAQGQEFGGRFAYTETWVNQNGKWQAVAEHITEIKN